MICLSMLIFSNVLQSHGSVILYEGSVHRVSVKDQAVLDFQSADILFITEQQLWLTSENGAFVRTCQSTRVPLS